jgi:flavin-dependent dehydrogenase
VLALSASFASPPVTGGTVAALIGANIAAKSIIAKIDRRISVMYCIPNKMFLYKKLK